MKSPSGVFCLEGYSPLHLNAYATLQLLRDNCGVAFFYQAPVTYEQFWQYLDRWVEDDGDAFPVLFLGFHGERGELSVGGEIISLEGLGEHLRGAGSSRWLHISACSTLRVGERRLDRFLAATKFAGISGYEYDVRVVDAVVEDFLALRRVVRRPRR